MKTRLGLVVGLLLAGCSVVVTPTAERSAGPAPKAVATQTPMPSPSRDALTLDAQFKALDAGAPAIAEFVAVPVKGGFAVARSCCPTYVSLRATEGERVLEVQLYGMPQEAGSYAIDNEMVEGKAGVSYGVGENEWVARSGRVVLDAVGAKAENGSRRLRFHLEEVRLEPVTVDLVGSYGLSGQGAGEASYY